MTKTSLDYQIHTFGCKVNTYDAGLLEKRFAESFDGASASSAEKSEGPVVGATPKVHVLNTCAVTAEATQEALRTIRRLKNKNPECKIVVTGCSAQVDTEKFIDVKEVDLVVANSHKGQLQDLIGQLVRGDELEKVYKSNIFKKDDLEEGGGREEAHTRSFLKIQDGCNSFCTFCVIPFARGKSRSLTIESIRERVKALLHDGVREVVLTGVHIGDYEFGLENLIEDILLNTRVPRLRLTSLEPIELNDRLLELFQDPRLCPHFHMSIQSANTQVLSLMKRKYTGQEVEDSLRQVQKKIPQAFVGMDVIVGFPGETDEYFNDTYERLAGLPWTKIHVFPYSERPGTYAMKLPLKNDRSVIVRRADQLRHLSFARQKEMATKQVGTIKKVLVLKNGQGLSRDYWPVEIEMANLNSELSVKITGLKTPKNSQYELTLQAEII